MSPTFAVHRFSGNCCTRKDRELCFSLRSLVSHGELDFSINDPLYISAPKPRKMGRRIRFDFAFFGQFVRERREIASLTCAVYRETIRVQYRVIEFRNSEITPTSSNNNTAYTSDFRRSYFTCRIRMSLLLRTIDYCVRCLQYPTKYINICLFLVPAVLTRFRLTYFSPIHANDVSVN